MSSFVAPVEAAAASLVARELGFGGLLKMSEADYRQALAAEVFFHINAAPCNHAPEVRYAMVPLLTSQAKGHESSTVDALSAIEVECEVMDSYARLGDVPNLVVTQLIGRSKSTDELVDLMVRRYGRLRGWTHESALELPVVLSQMRNMRRSVNLSRTESHPAPTSKRSSIRSQPR